MKRNSNAGNLTIPDLKLRQRITVMEAEWATKQMCGPQKENRSLGNKPTQPQSTKVLTEEFKSQIEQKNFVSKQCWGKYRRKGQRCISFTLHKNHFKCEYGPHYNTWNYETTAAASTTTKNKDFKNFFQVIFSKKQHPKQWFFKHFHLLFAVFGSFASLVLISRFFHLSPYCLCNSSCFNVTCIPLPSLHTFRHLSPTSQSRAL